MNYFFISLHSNVANFRPMCTRGIRIPRLLTVRNNLNNYFFFYEQRMPSRIRVELASLAYLGLGII